MPDITTPSAAKRLLSAPVRIGIGVATLACASLLFVGCPLTAPVSEAIEIADLTWVEVREAVAHGATTVLVPSGGLEQNGPHMIIGKHDRIVAAAAHRIAAGLGRTLVAPVVSFVPEGRHWPPTGHLRFPGTIGVTEEVFAGTLDGIARSLKAAGFRTICLMADHGDSMPVQREVARRLSAEWATDGVRVVSVDSYYDDAAQLARLSAEGETPATIGRHGGIQDTSELLFVHPAGIRTDRVGRSSALGENPGSDGDASRATAERGRELLGLRIDAAIAQIRALRAGG